MRHLGTTKARLPPSAVLPAAIRVLGEVAARIAFQFSDADWKRTLNRYRFCCAYCGESGPLTMDHVVPISRGGRHSIGNVVPACGPCNFGKHTSLAIEWRRRLGAGKDPFAAAMVWFEALGNTRADGPAKPTGSSRSDASSCLRQEP